MALARDEGCGIPEPNLQRFSRDDTLQELGDFGSSTPHLGESKECSLTIDLRGTLDVLKAADIQMQMECREYHSNQLERGIRRALCMGPSIPNEQGAQPQEKVRTD